MKGGMNARAILSANFEQKQTFLDSVIPYLKKFGFQGLDLDLEYPRKEQVINIVMTFKRSNSSFLHDDY